MHVVMVAAENAALPGAKVGGIGDVIRDVPTVLAAHGHPVTVVMPGYGFLSRLPQARHLQSFTLTFSSALEPVELYEVDMPGAAPGLRTLLVEHHLFGNGGNGSIYHHDPHEPFATDARAFALFCQAVCHALVTGVIDGPDVLHLHDWHAAMLLLLRQAHPAFQALQQVPTVYSIHNLSLQGIRPLRDNWSSPGHWYPELAFDEQLTVDPRYPDCINLMRAGINLADRVHVVSPTYAGEIQQPSEPAQGLVRGEGLEGDLQIAREQGRLFGILNGCDYSQAAAATVTHKQFVSAASRALEAWSGNSFWLKATLPAGLLRLESWRARTRKPPLVVASVGRLTDQKARLLAVETAPGVTALDAMLRALKSGIMIILGSGDEHYERFLLDVMRRHDNFVFLNGFSESLSDVVYRYCDLFLMPSSFEPCGISQMLAMRAGTPCLVHRVGGLADTVTHLDNGFCFEGSDPVDQASAMVRMFTETLQIHACKQPLWSSICKKAANSRFSWEQTINEYEKKLYPTPALRGRVC